MDLLYFGKINLYKVDQYNNRIANVKFELKDSSNKVVATGTTDANGFKGHANGTLHLESESTGDSDNQINIDVGANASLNLRSYNKIEIICTDRIKPSEQLKNFVWIDDFKVLKTAIDNYNGEKIEIHQVIESSWHISANLAAHIGLAAKGSIGAGISNDSKYCFHIIIE